MSIKNVKELLATQFRLSGSGPKEADEAALDVVTDIIKDVANSVRYADIEDVTPTTSYDTDDAVDCFKAQAHTYIENLAE